MTSPLLNEPSPSPNFTILPPQNFLHILLHHFHFFIKHPTRTSDKMLSSSTGSSCVFLAADLRWEAFGLLVLSVVSIVVSSQVSSFHWRKSFLLLGLSITVGSDSVDALCLLNDCFNSMVCINYVMLNRLHILGDASDLTDYRQLPM